MTSSSELAVSRVGGVVVAVLDRPRARNALSSSLVDAVDDLLRDASSDDTVRCVVVSGSEPGFCAGSDLKELSGMSVAAMAAHEARTGQVVRSIQHLGKPVIAAVEGFALGGGFLLATGCDVVVTAADARWHLPEVTLGWVPPWGLQTLLARVSPVVARRLAWGDESLTGAALLELGAVDHVTPRGSALDRAMEVAQRLAGLPPRAISSTKAALSDAIVASAECLDARATRLFAADCATDVARASLASFARNPGKGST